MNNADETLDGEENMTPAAGPAGPAPTGPSGDDGKLPIEVWAERKGLLPRMLPGPGGERLNPHNWKFAAVQALSDGAPVTEEEFDRQVEEQGKHIIR